MQLMEKEFIRVSYAEGDRLLHELLNGSFQFGAGSDADIVTDLEQVSMFPAKVQDRVKTWLERDGVSQAKKDKNAVLLQEQAEKSGPGVLDTLVKELGPELQGALVALVKDFLKQAGKVPETESAAPVLEKIQTGSLVLNEAGNREFIPDEDEQARTIARELEHDERIAQGLADAPDTAEGGELVYVGAGEHAPGPMGAQIEKAKPVRKK